MPHKTLRLFLFYVQKNETIEHSDPEQNKDITQQSVTEKSHSLPAIQPQNTTSLLLHDASSTCIRKP